MNRPNYVVLRKPGLMEDEGHYELLVACDTRQEIAEFCKEYTEDDTGYFRMSSLVWIGSMSHNTWVPEELRKWMPVKLCRHIRSIVDKALEPYPAMKLGEHGRDWASPLEATAYRKVK